jgi:hypothetical protein
MKRTFRTLVSVSLILLTHSALVDAQWNRGNLRETLRRLEEDTDRFSKSLNYDLDHGPLDGTRAEDDINKYVHEFEEATDKLKDRYEDQKASPNLAREVMVRGRSVDSFMRRNRPGERSMTDWTRVRASLDQLAYAYRIRWRW